MSRGGLDVHSQRENWRSQAANRQKTIAPPQPPSTPPPVYSNIGKMETLESRSQYVKHLSQLHAQRKRLVISNRLVPTKAELPKGIIFSGKENSNNGSSSASKISSTGSRNSADSRLTAGTEFTTVEVPRRVKERVQKVTPGQMPLGVLFGGPQRTTLASSSSPSTRLGKLMCKSTGFPVWLRVQSIGFFIDDTPTRGASAAAIAMAKVQAP